MARVELPPPGHPLGILNVPGLNRVLPQPQAPTQATPSTVAGSWWQSDESDTTQRRLFYSPAIIGCSVKWAGDLLNKYC